MKTGDHSDSIPFPVSNVDCSRSPVTVATTVVIASQASGDCNSVESTFTNGMLF